MKPGIIYLRPFMLTTTALLGCLILATTVLADSSPDKTFNPKEIELTGEPVTPALKNSPSRTVMQVIDNQFYKWLEYDNPDGRPIHIYMLEPEQKNLSADQATALLEASAKWHQESPAFQNFTQANSIVQRDYQASTVNIGPSRDRVEYVRENTVELEFITDNRTAIRGSDAVTYPYYTVGYLTIDFAYEIMRGTAFLVSPYTALTNAHNLYYPVLGGWFGSIEFTPGQYETNNNEVIRPFPTARAIGAEVNRYFLEYENSNNRDAAINHDYGAIFFDQPFSGISTFMPLEFNHIPDQISLVGYPGIAGDSLTLGMWQSDGPLLERDRFCLYYNAYTSGGNSGSPVFVYNENADTYRVVAIHSFASEYYFSGGPHLNSNNRRLIEQWLRWEPESDTPDQDDSEHEEDTDNDLPGVPSISLDHSELTLRINEKRVLLATTTGSIEELVWTTNHPNVAVVNDHGVVTAVGPGQTTIMARTPDGRVEAGCEIMVLEIYEDEDHVIAPNGYLLGDISGSGRIDVQDVVLVSQYLLRLTELDEQQIQRADVNGDRRININDVTLIMRYAVGIIDSFE